jgi:hypothetical protein
VHAFIYASLLPQELQARQDLPTYKPLS